MPVDQTIFCPNKTRTVPVEDVPSFKDPTDKRLEALYRAMFSLADSALDPVLVRPVSCFWLCFPPFILTFDYLEGLKLYPSMDNKENKIILTTVKALSGNHLRGHGSQPSVFIIMLLVLVFY